MNIPELITICIYVGVLLYILLGTLTIKFYLWHGNKFQQGWEAWRRERNKPPQDRNYLRAKTAFNKIQDKHSWAERYHDPEKIALYWPVVLLWYKRGTPVDLTRY